MHQEVDPKGLTWPIKPSIVVDDSVTGTVNVCLSPEIPPADFSLKQCFENLPFKNESQKGWAKVLREIADNLEQKAQ